MVRWIARVLMVAGLVGTVVPTTRAGEPTPSQVDLSRMAEAIGPAAARAALVGIATRADAVSARGPFEVELVALGEQVRFVQRREGTPPTALLRQGSAAYQISGGEAARVDPQLAGVVRGHDVHRALLTLEHWFRVRTAAGAGPCVAVEGPDGAGAVCADPGTGLPARFESTVAGAAGTAPLTIEFDDWRAVHGVRLPFEVRYLQPGAVPVVHRMRHVLPFRLAPGTDLPVDPRASFDRLGDLHELAVLHHDVVAAHQRREVAGILAAEDREGVVVRRGRLQTVVREAVAEQFAAYFAATAFERYEDVAVPVVAVAADGSLGWLACEVSYRARSGRSPQGPTAADPGLHDGGFAWVELFVRREGRWWRHGNASSALP